MKRGFIRHIMISAIVTMMFLMSQLVAASEIESITESFTEEEIETETEVTAVSLAEQEEMSDLVPVEGTAAAEMPVVDSFETEAVMAAAISETDTVDSMEVISVNPMFEAIYGRAYLESLLTAAGAGDPMTAAVTYGTQEEAVAILKAALMERTTSVSIGLLSASKPSSSMMSEIFQGAIACDSGSGSYDGDALRSDYLSWKASGSYYTRSGQYYITMKFTVVYCTTAEQETVLRAAITSKVEEMNLKSLPEDEIIREIHDFICSTVSYDHSTDSGTLKHSAYAAMINKKAVCQGYTSLFYRMCREAGVSVRMITGVGINNSGETEDHAWNIASVSGKYYNVDTTWDAGSSVRYTYFMKSDAEFPNHTRDDEYLTESFQQSYPMSASSYALKDSSENEAKLNGLVDTGNQLVYYVDNAIQSSYTGLVTQDNVMYYVENGVVHTGFTSLLKFEGTWYYIEAGKVNTGFTSLFKYNGAWYYIENGKLNWNFTGLTKYNGVWYYVRGGVLDWNYSGLCKNNGMWFYVGNGQVDWNFTGLTKYCGAWFYVAGGMLDWNYTGLCKNNGMWFYVGNGQVDWNFTGLTKYCGVWFYVAGGMLDWNYIGLCVNNGVLYYVSNGQVNWNYTGTAIYNGVTYNVVGGYVR